MLHGMSNQPIEYLVKLARSWSKAPECAVRGRDQGLAYDQAERAYVMANTAPQSDALELTLEATPGSPVLNPAFIIRNWGEAAPTLKIDGVTVPRGERFQFGHVATLQGTDLICWIKLESTSTVSLGLLPEGK